MFSPTEEIKARLDLVEFISSYLKIQKAGINYRALCPFHQEKTPSFFISPVNQIWHCFGGCAEGGDIFKFVMKMENVDFKEALKILAEKAGVELKSEDAKFQSERQQLYEINKLAADFFFDNLKKNAKVKEYLKKRGLIEGTIEDFKIGYALDDWRTLLNYLKSKKIKEENIEKVGLIIQQAQGVNNRGINYYDRFRDRIMFPIFDINGKVVGFSGRIFGEAKEGVEAGGKYVNTPETLIYKKGYLLYGLDMAKMEIKKNDFCVLVEGQMDLIMSHQAGVKNTVASSGTALTNQQLTVIKRYTDNLVFAYDSDEAGIHAANKGIDMAIAHSFNVKVAIMDQKDPADLVLEEGSDVWADKVKNAKTIMEHYFTNVFKKFNADDLAGKKEAAKILLKEIKKIPNKIEVAYWLSQLANKINIKEEYLAEELKNIKLDSEFLPERKEEIEVKKKNRPELLIEILLTLLIKNPPSFKFLNDFEFLPKESDKKMTRLFYEFKNYAGQENIVEILKEKLPDDHKDYFNYLLLKSEVISLESEDVENEIKLCIKELKVFSLKENLNMIADNIRKNEEIGDESVELIEKFQNLSRELNQIINS